VGLNSTLCDPIGFHGIDPLESLLRQFAASRDVSRAARRPTAGNQAADPKGRSNLAALCELFHARFAPTGGACKVEGDTMQTYDDLVELARICLEQSRESKNPFVSAELKHVAKGYQLRAAAMNNGKLPDIGEE
jgi:hypothetical protein